MSKSILLPIHPEYCEYIFSGIKKREIRKVLPKIEFPCKVYVYMTQEKRLATFIKKGDCCGQGIDGKPAYADSNCPVRRYNPLSQKVIGEFICTGYDKLVHCGTTNHNAMLHLVDDNYNTRPITKKFLDLCCLSYKQLEDYSKGGDLYALHITDARLYVKPKELSEFTGLRKTKFGYEPVDIKRPPQSFCYVEEI